MVLNLPVESVRGPPFDSRRDLLKCECELGSFTVNGVHVNNRDGVNTAVA
jgi:hypothetical protein